MLSMVAQRMKSLIMTTSIDSLRQTWNAYDKKKLGVLQQKSFAKMMVRSSTLEMLS